MRTIVATGYFLLQCLVSVAQEVPVSTYYEGGGLESIGAYKNGKKDGRWKEFHFNGSLRFQGNYKSGKLQGDCNWFYENDVVEAKGEYKAGILVSTYVEYYEDGKIKERGIPTGKEEEIRWQFYDREGQLTREGISRFGLEEGMWRSYYSNNQIWQEEIYMNGELAGVQKTYFENGNLKKIGTIYKYDEVGEWKYYNESGTLDSVRQYDNPMNSQTDSLRVGILSEGIRAYVKDNKVGFLNEQNEVVHKHENGYIFANKIPFFAEGRCMFIESDGNRQNRLFNIPEEPKRFFGFLDKDFKVVIPAIYPYGNAVFCDGFRVVFSRGHAVVTNPDPENPYTFLIIDTVGTIIGKPFNYDYGCLAACAYYPSLSEGVYVKTEKEKYKYAEAASGKNLLLPSYTLAGPFSEGLAAVEINYQYIIFIDRKGKQIINQRFYSVKRGSKEKSFYHPGNGCDRLGGFVNGKMVLHFFENNGLGPAVLAVIDKSGRVLTKKRITDELGTYYELYELKEFKKYKMKFDCD